MRKLLLLTLLLAMQSAVKGQAGFELLYWFNDEPEQKSETVIQNGEFLLDVQHLNVGIHNLHLQLKDSCGTVSSPITKSFYKTALQDKEMKFNYWFDGNDTELKTETVTGNIWKSNIDVKNLNVGLHTFYVQATDYCGTNSPTIVRDFYKTIHGFQDTKYTCWFDEDYTTAQTGTYNGDVIWLDVSELQDGFHTLYIQTEQYAVSKAIAHSFIKVPQTESIGALTCLIFIDDKLYLKENIEPQAGILNLDIDVESLSQGVHTLQTLVVTPTGAATKISNHFFIRSTTDNEMANLKCFYNVDGYDNYIQAGTYSNGTYHFDVDVSSLDDGIHQLNYMLVGDNGVSSEARTSFFVKTPVGGNGIMQYEYWLNDNDRAKIVKRLQERNDPLKLITLLPVESVPIRSSQFHFEVKGNKPMIYAKNTLNMRFFDVSPRFTDFSREYIDYNVSQEVKDITSIARDEKSKTFAAPGENEIKWFSFEAQEGDSLAFSSSQATSLQLFSPSGKEIFTTKGAESTQIRGCHTWENGIHYIAAHDVTGSNQEMTLNILHMDKYDVVYQDVRVVGDAGASTVTYRGNGLKALCEVRFINAQNDTIVAEYIERTSDAEVGIIADFNMATQGDYDAMFIFSGDEYKIVKNSVTVEEATEINLETEVKFATSFLRGTANTYNISITNTGNMTAYYVPLEIKLITGSIDNITDIKFGDELKSINHIDNFEFIDFCDDEEKQEVLDIINSVSEISQFTVLRDSISKKDYGLANFLVSIPPRRTKRFSVTINSSETIELYAYTSRYWFPVSGKNILQKSSSRINRETMCCYKDRIQCIADIAGYVPRLPGGCVIDFAMTGLNTAYDVWCSEGNNVSERWNNYLENNKSSLTRTLIQNAVSCVIGHFSNQLKKLKEDRDLARKLGSQSEVDRITSEIMACRKAETSAIRAIYEGVSAIITGSDCYKAFTEKKPNCPPNPGGGGGKSTPVAPCEPNDIVGFTAESGSKYIPSNFENTHYTIRSENDPVFATAAAHTVIVTDTLDGSKLDLTTFAARSVKIGDKVMELNGEKSFVKTLDLRTEIDVIAEVTLDFDEQTGVTVWTIRSLDPMTMEPTTDPMQGVLPVNNGGNGEAEFSFDIKLKQGLADGEKIDNIANIIFDSEEPIYTPVWTNIIDDTKPVSAITGIEEVSDSTILVNWEGSDEGSGIYRYQLYVQAGEDAEWKPMLKDTLKTSSKLLYKRDIDFGFCIIATDSAGNVEAKEMTREFEFKRSHIAGDADRNGSVDILDINATLNHILGNESTGCDMMQMDSNSDGKIDLLDINTTLDIILNNGSVSFTNKRRKTNIISIINQPVL